MRVLHFSTTPLVGAPGNISRALRRHRGIDSRWVVLDTQAGNYQKMAFDLDLDWRRDKDEVIAFAESADLLHLHNFIDLSSEAFSPLSFRALWAAGKPMVRQLHSTPEFIARQMGMQVSQVLACEIPKFVIAQHPERYVPGAHLVPNLVDIPPDISRRRPGDAAIRIGYAPSRFNTARSSRWDTKSYSEVRKTLARLKRSAHRRGIALELDIIELVPHRESLQRKADCDLFVDDLVTGSYHLNTLEALALGVPCLTYLDARTLSVVSEVCGRSDFPVLNVPLEHAHDVLLALASDRAAIRSLGDHAARWMAAHWSGAQVARKFHEAYEAVLRAPRERVPNRFSDDPGSLWRSTTLHDVIWKSRWSSWPAEDPAWWLRARGAVGYALRRFRS